MPPAPTMAPMTSPTEPRTPALYHAAPRGAVAVWLAGGGLAAILIGQIALGVAGAPPVVVLGGGYVLAVGVVLAGTLGMPAGTLGVTRVAPRFVVAAVLVGVASWYPRIRLVEWLAIPDTGKALVRAATEPSLIASLICVVALPAIAEELVFRGVIARALAPWSRWLAVIVSAIIFAGYHVLPAQVVAVFPFGLALGYLAVRSDSIVPSMIAHAINNLAGILVARGHLVGMADAIERHPQVALVGSIAIVAGGLALA
jgi:membrane protease YdiL (CAAX protease family)